jgi:tetratricopeptide (TPR) repeat protein
MKRLAGLLILLAYPALFFGAMLWEDHVCGRGRGLWQDASCKSPHKARPHGLAGAAYLEMKEWDLAIGEFELADQAARANPEGMSETVGSVSLANIAAVHLYRAHEILQSGVCIQYADQHSPLFASLLAEQDRCFARIREEYVAADRVLERARNEYPPDHLVLNNSIEVLLLLGETQRAFQLAEAALAEFPDSSPLAWTMGDVLAELGDCDAQARWIQKSLALDLLARYPVRACIAKKELSF